MNTLNLPSLPNEGYNIPPVSKVCILCEMLCTGKFFSSVKLDEQLAQRTRLLGMWVFDKSEKLIQ